MKYPVSYVWLAFLTVIFCSADRPAPFREKIKGIVVDSNTTLPVEKAYIYIVAGEEEALSSKDGTFEIITWQDFPLSVEVQHSEYKPARIAYKTSTDKLTIKLQLNK